jgi:hypothetical protein
MVPSVCHSLLYYRNLLLSAVLKVGSAAYAAVVLV